MKVEALESMGENWTRWQGYVINGVFPLGRYLGGSDHSGVFLTKSPARQPLDVAVKLVPASRALTESLLPRWKRAGSLAHPHLIRLLEWGGCQLDGLPYLYIVMEYADQTLAQLLQSRALTDDEAREMLPPILDALVFLHGRRLVQAHLTPANILVVGDQLKLASDTIQHFNESTPSNQAPSVYDAPEALRGSRAAPGDIWALGVSVVEALTRRPPSGYGDGRSAALPADFSPTFREVVTRCLSSRPEDRPRAADLAAWASGAAAALAPVATVGPVVALSPEVETPAPPQRPTIASLTALEAVTPAVEAVTPAVEAAATPLQTATPGPSMAPSSKPRVPFAALLGAIVILGLGWTAVRMLTAHHAPPAPSTPHRASGRPPSQTPATTVQAKGETPPSAASTPKPGGGSVVTSPLALHEELPKVPRSARLTIRGHIKVWVRVIVEQDGSVLAAVADRAGPSRYFERLAIEAAKKWTFPPADTPSRRLMQVRFDFSRDQTTGRAVTLR